MMELANGYWMVQLSSTHARIDSLSFDALGHGRYGDNLLKLSSPAHVDGIAAGCGAQTGYCSNRGTMLLSATAGPARAERVGASELAVRDIRYGDVEEHWRLRLEHDRLVWTIEQRWGADLQLTDMLAPALFFAARSEYGEATVCQIWHTNTSQDDFYDGARLRLVEGAPPYSRRTARDKPAYCIAKLLSHARPNGDLRLSVTGHLKKGELLNVMSFLGQSLWCEPDAPCFGIAAGDRLVAEIVLQPIACETGSPGCSLDIDLQGALREDVTTNRRFFDTHVNCGIMADTARWRFGNEPSGYVALFCLYMHAEMLKFGVPGAPLGPGTVDAQGVLALEVAEMARSLMSTGTVGPGYQANTSLDNIPSFLLAMRDLCVLTGDRDAAARMFPAAWIAARQLMQRLAQGDRMIATDRKRGNDYWDWIARDGRLTSINVLTYMALAAFREVARWLDRAAEHDLATEAAGALAERFNADFWAEDRGYYADWIGADGTAHFYLYAGPQLQAIVSGMVPPDRAGRVVDAIRRRRAELGPEWSGCFSLQTNFFDAQQHTTPYLDGDPEVTRFGQTMNGGCLASWNYYWIGALVKTGYVEEALEAWRAIVRRFGATSLVEGCNYWDYAGAPSRTTPADLPELSYEPFLADQGLVAAALPRWLLGIDPRLDQLRVEPVLPTAAYPATVSLQYLGKRTHIHLEARGDAPISVAASG